MIVELMVVAFGALVIAAGVRHTRRMRALREERDVLSDDLIRQLETDGFVVLEDEEPLDPEAIREAEERFWEEERWE